MNPCIMKMNFTIKLLPPFTVQEKLLKAYYILVIKSTLKITTSMIYSKVSLCHCLFEVKCDKVLNVGSARLTHHRCTVNKIQD